MERYFFPFLLLITLSFFKDYGIVFSVDYVELIISDYNILPGLQLCCLTLMSVGLLKLFV